VTNPNLTEIDSREDWQFPLEERDAPVQPADAQVRSTIEAWLRTFNSAVAAGEASEAAALFAEQSEWRDLVAITGELRSRFGREGIREMLGDSFGARLGPLTIDESFTPWRTQRSGEPVMEALVRFNTSFGEGVGVLHLRDEPSHGVPAAQRLLTTLETLRGYEERIGERRPSGDQYSRTFGGKNWADLRAEESSYVDREPGVLIIGAGQAGLTLGARLRVMGIDALIVDPHETVGNTWRERYHSLTLHNEIWSNHMPYMPFPETWPMYTPKDMLANWFDAYAKALELNVWTETTFLGGSYDEDTETWEVRLQTPQGEKTLYPQHVVMAIGLSGRPNIPALPGLEDFEGDVVHSGSFNSAPDYEGKHCVVIGTATSGHDAAQELVNSGAASVTMIQREPTTVLSIDPVGRLLYAVYEEGHTTEQADLILLSGGSYPATEKGSRALTDMYREVDAELIHKLNAAGFRTDYGADDTGHIMKQHQRGGGFYINVGGSDMIIEGKIRVVNWADVTSIVPDGMKLESGELLPADLFVMATGYKSLQSAVQDLFGSEVAEKVGPVWGFGSDGELRNMWRPTPQRGLWIAGGSFLQCRVYSKVIAQQIAVAGVHS
jgi:cation diffusion facilitator CzcD-associated flavoprotein CzcO